MIIKEYSGGFQITFKKTKQQTNLWPDDLGFVSAREGPADVARGVADVRADAEASAPLVKHQRSNDDRDDLWKSEGENQSKSGYYERYFERTLSRTYSLLARIN